MFNIFKSNSPWDSNTAVAQLLFKDEKKFNFYFPYFSIIKNELSEFSIFLNSGGVVQNTFHIPVIKPIFNLMNFIDKLLITLMPSVFALNRRVVIKKIK